MDNFIKFIIIIVTTILASILYLCLLMEFIIIINIKFKKKKDITKSNKDNFREEKDKTKLTND